MNEDLKEIAEFVNTNYFRNKAIDNKTLENKKNNEIKDLLFERIIKDYEDKMSIIPLEGRNEFEKAISLRVIDNAWVEHLNVMEHLREGIGLRGYAQSSPIQAYALEGFEIFENMLDSVDSTITTFLLKAQINQNVKREQTLKGSVNDGKEKIKRQPKKISKIGRNDPCPCGSGKKYKQCCGK